MVRNEYQMPSTPKSKGKTKTGVIWNTIDLAKDNIAEIKPLFRAVKNPEANIVIPVKANPNENNLNA